MPDPLVLYSATTKLAYNIAARFYGDNHYVWCAPRPAADRYGFPNPPSSDPLAIYWRYHEEVVGGDKHSPLIAQNRRGLLQGASVKEDQGVIDEPTRKLIEGMVGLAEVHTFSPLLLVIPFQEVRGIVKPAALASRAGATSDEYQIERLPRASFDVLEIHR